MGSVNLKIAYGGAASLFSLTIWISYMPRDFSAFGCELGVKVTSEALVQQAAVTAPSGKACAQMPPCSCMQPCDHHPWQRDVED